MEVDEAIVSRFTCRSFLDEPVPRAAIQDMLSLAKRAPSGSNIQPWSTWIVSGSRLHRLKALMRKAAADPDESFARSYQYYPRHWRDPWLQRRRQIGWKLYGTLGIGRGDREASKEQALKNYDLFGAPVGVFITLDETLEIGSFLDVGMFAQTFMLAAYARGYATAPQVSVAAAHEVLRAELELPAAHHVVMGIGLGKANEEAAENHLATERVDIEEFSSFIGFEDRTCEDGNGER